MQKIDAHLKKALESLDFSEKEASVYLSLLELGKGTVSEISRKAGINRTTGYDILDTLISKGLATISGKEPKQEYTAESPEIIAKLIQEKFNQAKAEYETVHELMPRLKSLHNTTGRPRVRFYEGKEGLKEVYEDTLTSTEAIRAYASVDDVQKTLPNYFPDYYKRRARKNIHIRAIFPRTQLGAERVSKNVEEKRETAFVPADTYYFSPEINIYDNKIMIASWKEELGIIIESKEIADAMKKIYELSWAEAKRLDAEVC